MAEWIATDLGEIRRPGPDRWVLRIPGCGKTELLNAEQFHGRLSVNHAAVCACGYHETHDFAEAVARAGGVTDGE